MDRYLQDRQHIIVIGAGLAGLTVAIALTRAGHKVDIVESAPKITYIGAGSPFQQPLRIVTDKSRYSTLSEFFSCVAETRNRQIH